MTPDEALALLGLAPGGPADAGDARRAYRAAARRVHPDRPDAPADATHQMTRLNEAYAVVSSQLAHGSGQTATDRAGGWAPDPGGASASERASTAREYPGVRPEAVEVNLDVDGTLLVEAPADETFALLAEAAEQLGDVTYVDRSSGLLQVLVNRVVEAVPAGMGDEERAGAGGMPHCYLTFSLQGRALGTEIFATIESMNGGPLLPLQPLLELLAELIAEQLG